MMKRLLIGVSHLIVFSNHYYKLDFKAPLNLKFETCVELTHIGESLFGQQVKGRRILRLHNDQVERQFFWVSVPEAVISTAIQNSLLTIVGNLHSHTSLILKSQVFYPLKGFSLKVAEGPKSLQLFLSGFLLLSQAGEEDDIDTCSHLCFFRRRAFGSNGNIYKRIVCQKLVVTPRIFSTKLLTQIL